MQRNLEPQQRVQVYCNACKGEVDHVIDWAQQVGNYAPVVCVKHNPAVLDREDDRYFPLDVFSPDEFFALNRVRLSEAARGDDYPEPESCVPAAGDAGEVPQLVVAREFPGDIPC